VAEEMEYRNRQEIAQVEYTQVQEEEIKTHFEPEQ
jgi:hypothetical protein